MQHNVVQLNAAAFVNLALIACMAHLDAAHEDPLALVDLAPIVHV